MLLTALTIFLPTSNAGQDQTSDLMAAGLRQFEAARTANTDSAYQQAQETFARVLAKEPNNPDALMHLGEAKVMRAFLLAIQAKYGPSTEFLQSGMADMDRAVTLAPDRSDLRLERGLNY